MDFKSYLRKQLNETGFGFGQGMKANLQPSNKQVKKSAPRPRPEIKVSEPEFKNVAGGNNGFPPGYGPNFDPYNQDIDGDGVADWDWEFTTDGWRPYSLPATSPRQYLHPSAFRKRIGDGSTTWSEIKGTGIKGWEPINPGVDPEGGEAVWTGDQWVTTWGYYVYGVGWVAWGDMQSSSQVSISS